MANKFHGNLPSPDNPKAGKGPPTGHRGPTKSDLPMKTANWAGLPGKSQSRNRSKGTKKLRQSPKELGI